MLVYSRMFLLLLCGSIATSGCGGDDHTEDPVADAAGFADATGSLAVTAGQGTTPLYSWTGGTIGSVLVTRTGDGSTVWGIVYQSPTPPDTLPSPLLHGTVPAGYLVLVSLEPMLTPGVQYQVDVVRSGASASAIFTP